MPVVARSRQPLGRDRPPLGPRARLQRVEQGEANGLLEIGVAVDLDVGAIPECVEVLALTRGEFVPAASSRARERGID